jgi:hypothetical protein
MTPTIIMNDRAKMCSQLIRCMGDFLFQLYNELAEYLVTIKASSQELEV